MPKGKTSTKECPVCKKQVSLFAFNRHIKMHTKKEYVAPTEFISGNCQYCNKEYFNKIGLGNHETRCPKNPNRRIQKLTEHGRQRTIAANKRRVYTDEYREKISAIMKQAVEKAPESYTSANRGRTKQIIYKGIKFQGQWELDFYKWAESEGLDIVRSTKGFKYNWNGERTYYPDFYIASKNLYVEVKGYETDRDRSKWLQFPEKLCIIKESQIKQIRNNTFAGL